MAGGAPAGIRMRAGEEGCRITSTKIRMMTIHGKRRTAPRGMEMEELPFNRTRRRKKANLGESRCFCWERSFREGRLWDDGIRLTKLCTRSIL